MLSVVPLVLTTPVKADQLPFARLLLCCNIQPVDAKGQDTMTLPSECVIFRVGAPTVCTTLAKLQKPPTTE